MPVYERGDVRIHYEDMGGDGFPLLLIAGGGLNSVASYLATRAPFNPMEELGDEYRCIAMDLRNANAGQSSGPLEIDRPWDSHTDDQLGLIVLGADGRYAGAALRPGFTLALRTSERESLLDPEFVLLDD